MLSWHFVSSAQYYGASNYDAEKLYFLSDTHEIYRGSVPFTEAVLFVDDTAAGTTFDAELAKIANPARRKIYLSKKTLAGKVYDGSAWTQIINPVSQTVVEGDTMPVAGGAVKTYTDEAIEAALEEFAGEDGFVKSLSYNSEEHTITAVGGEGSVIELDALGVELSYDSTTGALKLLDCNGVALGNAIMLDLERFVTAAEYDAVNKKIILYFDAAKTDKIEIPVGDLVDEYTAGNTDTISLTVSNNQFTGSVNVASGTGYTDNTLQVVAGKGLYVAPTDLSNYMQLVAGAAENDIATFGANGQVKDSGKKVGGAALAETPDADTLATEAAVEAIRAALQGAIDGKLAKVAENHGDEIVTATSAGQVQVSGKKMGAAALADTPDANTLATEKAVADAIAEAVDGALYESDIVTTLDGATDDTIPSAKAVADALAWETTM